MGLAIIYQASLQAYGGADVSKSMKVGIVTFQWSMNYGALLQAHALQTYLERRGHDVEIVDYRPVRHVSHFNQWIGVTPKSCFEKWKKRYREYLFESFRRRYLNRMSPPVYSMQKLSCASACYDVLISGSDQVWNPRWLEQFAGLEDLYFLTFADKRTKKVSYAASFGIENVEAISPVWRDKIKKRLMDIAYVSVREHAGVDVVKELTDRNDAVQVLDPTLLLEPDYYRHIVGRTHSRTPHVFSYILHGRDAQVLSLQQDVVSRTGMKIKCWNPRYTGLNRRYVMPSPVKWLQMIQEAGLVITNSFHAVVFSIMFHTPFLAIRIEGEGQGMNTRIIELLHRLGLEQWIVSSGQPCPDRILEEAVNWDDIDKRIQKMRVNSEMFLETAGL